MIEQKIIWYGKKLKYQNAKPEVFYLSYIYTPSPSTKSS